MKIPPTINSPPTLKGVGDGDGIEIVKTVLSAMGVENQSAGERAWILESCGLGAAAGEAEAGLKQWTLPDFQENVIPGSQ